MKRIKHVVLVLAALLLCTAAFADGIDLYVFNQHYDGKLWMNKSSLYAESGAFLKLAGYAVKSSAGNSVTVSVSGKDVDIPAISKGSAVFIQVKQAAKLLGLSFQYNATTQTVDVFKPVTIAPSAEQPGGQQADNPSAPAGYDVEFTDTKEDGIDELAVLVTLTNKGKPLPGLIVECDFMDQDDPTESEHVFDTQKQGVQNFAAGATATLNFTEPYPNKTLSGGYREYDKNIQYHITLTYVVPPPQQGR